MCIKATMSNWTYEYMQNTSQKQHVGVYVHNLITQNAEKPVKKEKNGGGGNRGIDQREWWGEWSICDMQWKGNTGDRNYRCGSVGEALVTQEVQEKSGRKGLSSGEWGMKYIILELNSELSDETRPLG